MGTSCRVCGKIVSYDAKVCPQCGADTPQQFNYVIKMIFGVIVLLFAVGIVASWVEASHNTKSVEPAVSAQNVNSLPASH